MRTGDSGRGGSSAPSSLLTSMPCVLGSSTLGAGSSAPAASRELCSDELSPAPDFGGRPAAARTAASTSAPACSRRCFRLDVVPTTSLPSSDNVYGTLRCSPTPYRSVWAASWLAASRENSSTRGCSGLLKAQAGAPNAQLQFGPVFRVILRCCQKHGLDFRLWGGAPRQFIPLPLWATSPVAVLWTKQATCAGLHPLGRLTLHMSAAPPDGVN